MILQSYTTTGDIFADTKPRGAMIFIDGVLALDDMCRPLITPIIITEVPKGSRKFTFRLTGYYDESVIVDIIGGVLNDAYGVLFPKIFM